MGAEGHRSRGALRMAWRHHLCSSCMSYWWAMGKIRKAASLLSSEGGGPSSRSATGKGIMWLISHNEADGCAVKVLGCR